MTVLLIGLGAAIGAPARYWTERTVRNRLKSSFPAGTLLVNLIACLVIAIVSAAAAHIGTNVRSLIAPGFCATLSTYSGFNQEALVLAETGHGRMAVGYVVLTIAAGIGAAYLGWTIGS